MDGMAASFPMGAPPSPHTEATLVDSSEPEAPRDVVGELHENAQFGKPLTPAIVQTDVIESTAISDISLPTRLPDSSSADQTIAVRKSHPTVLPPPTIVEPISDIPVLPQPLQLIEDAPQTVAAPAEPAFIFDAPIPSSPLSSIATPAPDADLTLNSLSQDSLTSPECPVECSKSVVSSALSDLDDQFFIEHDYDGPDGHRILRLKPSVQQWDDFPAILAFARNRGADEDGCFKVMLPEELQEPLPEKDSQRVPANAYKPKQIKKNSFWRVNTVPSEGVFASDVESPDYTAVPQEALKELQKMFRKNNDRQMRNVRYRVDVPAWTPAQRLAAGVPVRSPIYPLKGDKLDYTRAAIPGIHTPYVYESGPYFGASFQIHAEDFRLVSLNHLYKGRKIWIVVPSTAVDIAEEALGRKGKCSQFMRHRAEFFFPQKLEKLGIPYRIVDQRAGETIVILPDAYHEGFSTGYTIAEAKNYADENWTTDSYQPCEASCQLVTAIPADLMRPLRFDEVQIDLCANFELPVESNKRPLEETEMGTEDAAAKRVKA